MSYQLLSAKTEKPVYSWAGHELGSAEIQMAKNVASLPFVFKHVSLMPDVHLGKGALVGSVIATKDAVIPSAVGVDIGCFTGDTLIPLIDGQTHTLRELGDRPKSFYVYACTPTGKIVAAEAIARLTRRQASLVKVTLDNGKEIRCTPDHPFMLRDGSYTPANELQAGTSLMPHTGEICGDSAKSLIDLHDHRQYTHNYNHKVVAVTPLSETEDVCRKDSGVIDEIPAAYKPIEQVMAQQADLVEVVAILKQVLCVKG